MTLHCFYCDEDWEDERDEFSLLGKLVRCPHCNKMNSVEGDCSGEDMDSFAFLVRRR